MRTARRAGGFTLLELMVGAVISIITLGAIAASFAAAQGAYQAEVRIKSSVEGSRSAIAYLERTLAMAGYGVDPRYAFDFGIVTSGIKNNDILVTYSAPLKRPEVFTDDLAFRYRDANFLRRGVYASPNLSLSGGGTFPVALRQGQAIQLSCQGGAGYAAVRLGSAVSAGDTSANLDVGLSGRIYVSRDVTGVAPALPACFTGGEPLYVTLIHEVRVRIRMIGTGAQARPYLVVYHDLSSDVVAGTNPNYDPIAPDVEGFQVAYLMNRPPPGLPSPPAPTNPPDGSGGNWIMGDPVGLSGLPVAATMPQYDTGYEDGSRYTDASANIRAVRVSVMVRSAGEDPRRRTAFPPEAMEDRSPVGVNVADGYYRTRASSLIRVPNMSSRGFFNPPLKDAAMVLCPASNCTDLNLAGG